MNPAHITRNGAANFAPFFHPDGRHIIFSSNLADPQGRNFDLYMIRDDGTGFDTAANSPDQSGLGRSLIEAFVRQLRGELEVRSEQGTVVQVTFPAPLKDGDPKHPAAHHPNVAHEPERTQKTAGGVS